MDLNDLEVNKLVREISKEVREEFERFKWETKRTSGFQWIEAIGYIAANIAEGFGRYHYLDKNKFNYNARGLLNENQLP